MNCYSYKVWLWDAKIERYFKRIGYEVETFRVFLKNNFGFKSGAEIKDKYKITDSLLNAKFAYSEHEYFDLKTKISDLLEYLEHRDCRWWNSNRQVLFSTEVYNIRWDDPEFNEKIVGKYEMRSRFNKEISGFIKSLTDEITDTTGYGGY